jgi:hypothetical protein
MIGLGLHIQNAKGGGFQVYAAYKRRVEDDGGVMYSSKDCTLASINNLKTL